MSSRAASQAVARFTVPASGGSQAPFGLAIWQKEAKLQCLAFATSLG